MESRPLREQIAAMRQSFFDEDILDEQFLQLEALQDNDDPRFVEEVVTLYFRESTKQLANIEEAMESDSIDFLELDRIVHKLKGNSSSIGAKKVRIEINNIRDLLRERDLEGAKATFQQLRREHDILKSKLEPYFQQMRQAGPVVTATRPK